MSPKHPFVKSPRSTKSSIPFSNRARPPVGPSVKLGLPDRVKLYVLVIKMLRIILRNVMKLENMAIPCGTATNVCTLLLALVQKYGQFMYRLRNT
jgi:hypothetical protein